MNKILKYTISLTLTTPFATAPRLIGIEYHIIENKDAA